MVTRNFWDFELVPRTSQLRLESCILTKYIIEIEVEDLMKDVNKRLTIDTLMYIGITQIFPDSSSISFYLFEMAAAEQMDYLVVSNCCWH